MEAWELVNWLERSWRQLLVTEALDRPTKSVLRGLEWQSLEKRQEAIKRICENKNSSQAFIDHAERMLRVRNNYQARLALWK